MRPLFLLILTVAVAGFGPKASADTIVAKAVADTTLIETAPSNNMGGTPFFNAGSTLHGKKNRGLFRFNLESQIPPGSRVTSAYLVLEVVGVGIDEPASGNFRLHRLLQNWGEGTKVNNASPGIGLAATLGEATWNQPFALTTTNWSSPGGGVGLDYVSAMTAEQFIYNQDDQQYTFGPTSQMTADIQSWINNPEGNFGWLLKAEDEGISTTARRFASSEDEDYAPVLSIQFDPPPLLESTRSGSDVLISFQTRTNESYQVQQSASLNPINWVPLTNITASAEVRNVSVTNTLGTNSGFYRLLITE